MALSLNTQVRRFVRHFTDPLPRGTMVLVDTGTDLDHIEDFTPDPKSRFIEVVIDRPDDSSDRVDVPLVGGLVSSEYLTTTPARPSRNITMRNNIASSLGEGFVSHVEECVRGYAKECMTTFQSNLDGSWAWWAGAVKEPSVRLSWDPNRKASWGGTKGISIGLNAIFSLHDPDNLFLPIILEEYSHINRDPEIGRFCSVDWHPRLAALVAHEVAHCIDVNGRFDDEKDRSAHGASWQRIYRKLRVQFVHPVYQKHKKPLDNLYGKS